MNTSNNNTSLIVAGAIVVAALLVSGLVLIFGKGDNAIALTLILGLASNSVAGFIQNQNNANKQIQQGEKALVQNEINSEKLDGIHTLSNSRLTEMTDKIASLERALGNSQGRAEGMQAERDETASKTQSNS